ncbi:MAG: hypothetical protein FWD69_10215 [Polyangiaceae bacterium]|nr:hypothetical protein [Polyangiaceae bacterium]
MTTAYVSHEGTWGGLLAIWIDRAPTLKGPTPPLAWHACATTDYLVHRLCEIKNVVCVTAIVPVGPELAKWWAAHLRAEKAAKTKKRKKVVAQQAERQTTITISEDVETEGRRAAIEYKYRRLP